MKRRILYVFLASALTLGLISVPAQASITSIQSCTFGGTFTISNGVVTGATNCSGLAVIPEGVTEIGISAFEGQTQLINVGIPSTVTLIGAYAFAFNTQLAIVTFLNGSSITEIPTGMFNETGSLQVFEIPNSVTTIRNFAFYGTGLTSIVIPNSVTTIGNSAFYGSSNLHTVEMGTSVTTIGSTAFGLLPNLYSITLPSSLTSIGASAFLNSSSLSAIYFLGNAPTMAFQALRGTSASLRIYARPTAQGFSWDDPNFTGRWPTVGLYTGAFHHGYEMRLFGNGNASGEIPLLGQRLFAVGDSVLIPSNSGNLERAGYTFSGWNSSSLGNGTSYLSQEQYIFTNQDVDLHAVWTPDVFELTFNSNGGSAIQSLSFRTGESIQSAPQAPTRAGYRFLGWILDSGGEIVQFPFNPNVLSNMNLNARWQVIEVVRDTTPTQTAPADPGTNSPIGNVPSPSSVAAPDAPAQPTSKVKQKTPGASLATQIGMTVTPKAKIKLTVAKASKKICKVSGGRLVALKPGNCSVTVAVTPAKTKAVKKPKTTKQSTVVAIS
jgi:uncharacterized repeat protein (TIGR02543 family)